MDYYTYGIQKYAFSINTFSKLKTPVIKGLSKLKGSVKSFKKAKPEPGAVAKPLPKATRLGKTLRFGAGAAAGGALGNMAYQNKRKHQAPPITEEQIRRIRQLQAFHSVPR